MIHDARRNFLALTVALFVCECALAPAFQPAAAAEPGPYRETAAQIMDAALGSNSAYEKLGYLCDRIGPRLSGSPELEKAIDWAVQTMWSEGLENVHEEAAMVPRWVRGEESLAIVSPVARPLTMLGLGMSVGTPERGIEGEIVCVTSFEELRALGERNIRGRIVLYDMEYTGYGSTSKYRMAGPDSASLLGAKAVLVRSIAPAGYDTPHTGTLQYKGDAKPIPAAAISVEGASLIRRLIAAGDRVRVRLNMDAQKMPDSPSANVVAEIRGRERPEEVVLVSGHLDSWDVGQGAQDDGVGSIIAWESVRLLKELGIRPRRTVRCVLYTNEENGTAGAKAYREDHLDELPDHVAAIESDAGNGRADGFRLEIKQLPGESERDFEDKRAAALAVLHEIAPLFDRANGSNMRYGWSGVDISYLVAKGVPGLGLAHDTSQYYFIHHTDADTFDKIIPEDLAHNTALMTLMVYLLAEMPERLVP